MAVSIRFVVVVHILTDLALNDGKPMRSNEIAYSVNTSAIMIRVLLARLGKA
ncbi:Rrf2 family transcriptional regulator [Pectobacterium quasiaquaticum]|uniref:Rrf2 family transcriptional regulator n=1 Tax=Pectobacterium quasiaquaticum TaxID=2774015 RepID=UPI001CF77A29|nr:Rrf2 family transcriptional regulator [Pectobacterium quasiaquaticum]